MNNNHYSKQTIIIFEGADKSGKTTIANALSKELNVPIFKVERDKYNWDKEANIKYGTEQISQFLEQTGASVILDRFHPSDYMYSVLFGRQVYREAIKKIDDRFAKLNTLIVYCYKQPKCYEVDEEDKDFVDPSMYGKMLSLYQTFDSQSSCRSIFMDTSDMNLTKQLNKIKSELHEDRNL